MASPQVHAEGKAPATPAEKKPDVKAPAEGEKIPWNTSKLNIPYCGTDDPGQKLDIHYPFKPVPAPVPVVLYIHGGGMMMGDKSAGPAAFMIAGLNHHGYIVAAVNYRLAPKSTWPAQLEDLRCAVAFLKKNAGVYGIDPKRIGALGTSSGGHLAALAAFEGLFQAVVDMYAPTDLTVPELRGAGGWLVHVFGSAEVAGAVLKEASPLAHVKKGAPPFLIIHGENDLIVPMSQSKKLHEALTAAGVPSRLIPVKNAGHSLVPSGGLVSPMYTELADEIYVFFDRYLKS